MRTAALALALSSTALATIEGRLINRTTGRAVAGAAVTLVRMSATGRQTVATVRTDPAGRFAFDNPPEGVHYLLETQLDGVTYTRMVPPEGTNRNIELEVYNASRRRDQARLTQRIVFLEPTSAGLHVTESWLFHNDGRFTWNDPAGAFEFYVPVPAQDGITVMVTAPGGVPVPRQPQRAGRSEFFKVISPVKPGETRFDIRYTLPQSTAFTTRMAYPEVPVRLVVPAGVRLKGERLEALGSDPSGRAEIFQIRGRKEFSIEIEGSGTLADEEQQTGPALNEIMPPLYDRLSWVLAPACAALFFGFLLLYRRSSSPRGGTASDRP